MADADNKDNTSQSTDNNSEVLGLKSEISKINEMIAAQNEMFAKSMEALVQANTARKTVVEEDVSDEDIYQPRKLQEKILSQAGSIAQKLYKEERAKDMAVYTLAQEYPEIQSNPEIRKAVLEAQKSLPESIRDTADGYEMAVLKAVTKQGLVPKSKREVVDPDISAGGGRGSSARERGASRGKQKVSEETIEFARLMRGGRELTKEEMKGLEEAANRDTYSRYR